MLLIIFTVLFLSFLLIFWISFLTGFIIRIPFVPTKPAIVKKLIEVADLKKGQIVYDLGCGDMRILCQAEKITKTGGKGFEISLIPYFLALIRILLTRSKSKIYFKNFLNTSLRDADRIFIYLTPVIFEKLSNKILQECKPNTLIISHTFKIPNLKLVKCHPKEQSTPSIYVYTTT